MEITSKKFNIPRYLGFICLVSFAYFFAAKLGLSFAFVQESSTAIWPPTGLALAVLLVFGHRYWPAIFIGAFLANFANTPSLATALGIALGNTLEGIVGAHLVNRLAGGKSAFSNPWTIFTYAILAGICAPILSATIGVTSLTLGGFASLANFHAIWLTWWLGDLGGALIIAPLLILWFNHPIIKWSYGKWIEAAITLVLLSIFCFSIFDELANAGVYNYPLSFLVLPILTWVCFRFTQREVISVIAVLSVIAIWGTLHGQGPFIRTEMPNESLLLLQTFMAVIAVTHLILSAVLQENRAALEKVEKYSRTIELERTKAEKDKVRLEAILGSMGEGIMVIDKQLMSVVMINDAGAKMLGREIDQVIGERLSEVAPLEDEAGQSIGIMRPTMLALETRQRVETPPTSRQYYVRKDGSRFLVGMTASPIEIGGNVFGVVLVFRDVTQERESEKRKDEFLATLAHELRNPLSPILSSLELLRLSPTENAEMRKATQIMERQTRHMARLLDDLLDVSRITRGKVTLKKEIVNISETIGKAVETARPVIEAQRHAIAVDVPRKELYLETDPLRLEQIIVNLLNNAAKYTEPGGHIWLTCKRNDETEDGEVVITVRDDGTGISHDLMPKIFDQFTQARSAPHGGLGIGLHLVKNLVELHGGTVSVRSAGIGKGSEFSVRLPARRAVDKNKAAAPGGPDVRVQGDKKTSGRKVLIVDDNADAASSLGKLLMHLGHTVEVANDGITALNAARRFLPEVILLDLGLPGMDGFEIARHLKKDQSLPPFTLVALTGYGQPEDRKRTEDAGFDHHLVKPVGVEALVKVMGG